MKSPRPTYLIVDLLNIVCDFIALFLGIGLVVLGRAGLEQVEVVGHGLCVLAVLDLLVRLRLVDRGEEVHVDGRADSPRLDTGLDTGEGQPFRVVCSTLELIDELVVLHYLDMINLVLILFVIVQIPLFLLV